MNIVRWTPWREMNTLNNRINRFFNDSFIPSHWLEDDFSTESWNPVVDVYDKGDQFVIKAELPGMKKKDIEIDLKDSVLTIKGERSHENEVKEGKYYRKERSYGKFQRSFTLPNHFNPEKIKADFKDGILKIEIAKPEEMKPKQITIH